MTAEELESDVSIMIQESTKIDEREAKRLSGLILLYVMTNVLEVLRHGASASEPIIPQPSPALSKDDPRSRIKAGG